MWQPTAACGLPGVPDAASCSRDCRSRPLACADGQASFCADDPCRGRSEHQPSGLLREPKSGWSAGHLLFERRREVLRHLEARRIHQVDPDQRLARPNLALRGLCGADEARGALGIPAVSAHPPQADPGSSVGLSLQPAQRDGIRHLHDECPARGDISLCLERGLWLSKCTESGQLLEEDQRSVLSPSLSSPIDEQRRASPGAAFSNLIT